MNRSLRRECETIFMMPTLENSYVASRLVKEVAALKGNYRQYVPEVVAEAIEAKLAERRGGND